MSKLKIESILLTEKAIKCLAAGDETTRIRTREG
jgi:hypothetical protein